MFIKNQLFEIEKTKKVIDEHEHDRIAVKELTNILVHQQNLLNQLYPYIIFTQESPI
jgi:hypothetical protein